MISAGGPTFTWEGYAINDVLIQMKDAARTYLMGEVHVKALHSVNLTIRRGELVVILGPSGSGKSTLLNLLGGMDRPDRGRMTVSGRNLADASDRSLTRYRRQDVGFVFQFYNLIPDLTARENVALAAKLVPNPLSIEEVLIDVGLRERMDHFPAQLSGGEQQRVSIARALVKRPKILLCDEPTGALDFETGKRVLTLLARINQERGTTVVIVTHNTPLAEMAGRVIRMRSGCIAGITENAVPVSPDQIEW